MFEFHSLPPTSLGRFLERQKAGLTLRPEIDLDVLLKQILQKAYEFVPSQSGSILLDDPLSKSPNRKENELVFIATFGEGSEPLLGTRLSAARGIAGRVYETGCSYLSEDVDSDEFFYPDIDAKLGFKTHSLVCVPIYIGKNACGVLELINRSDGKVFTNRDMTLLEIFAGYTSFTLQNALDAKRAHELAKRDDLTGLYNDRWFHVRLAEALAEADATGKDCVLLFMDLDNFKAINDRHGHLAGSQVLREVGFLLKRVVEKEHSTVSRYGGDEFVMVLPNTSLQEGIQIAADMRSAIEDTSFLEHEYGFGMPALHIKGVLSASVGVALYQARPQISGSIDARKNDLLRRADSAMYEAKSGGKGKIVVSHPEPGGAQRFEVVAPRARVAAGKR
ncbi:MAG TPA: sensor domain-containing diguanylate cyclase [Thermoanaerobaculia bacterium]